MIQPIKDFGAVCLPDGILIIGGTTATTKMT
jgi:hypothetical protein